MEYGSHNGDHIETETEKEAEAAQIEISGNRFTPYDLSTVPPLPSGLPPEIWTIVQSAPANFPPQYFLDVSRNLLENPNLTASHLARAELSYQSFNDATFNPTATRPADLATIVKHLRPECQPRLVEGGVEGYELEWTVVRKLIPRNPKLDDTLIQTCHLFMSSKDIPITTAGGTQETLKSERYLVIYIPHVVSPDEIPFYHPKVRSLGILYTYLPNHDPSQTPPAVPGTLSIYLDLFPSYPLDNRLTRTALKLLEIIHKHSRGRQAGYQKRVHHDQIIPQKRFQDTYAYLKGKYAKRLIDGWVEQTPPEKHVFEDLGIAAFLIELWVDMYSTKDQDPDPTSNQKTQTAQTNFPGFVDIGCGNGLLVYILNAEGWEGWGFDARKRKSWSTYGSNFSDKLKEQLLVPSILTPEQPSTPLGNTPPSHDGLFPTGTFIISNHADELTPWTPLLAYLSQSPFIAIPCCSHDFGGTRFRSPVHKKYVTPDPNATGKEKNKQPSAYASLCSWVSHLTESVGHKIEKEHLRIPSTRNIAILGRGRLEMGHEGEKREGVREENDLEGKMLFARELVEKEMGGATTIEQVRLMWMRSGGDLVKPGKGGH
jgi:tRNASer (uridine44-2'-O)-methyltransferase